MGIVTGMLKLFFGTKSEKDRKEIEPYVEKIKAVYPLIEQLTNDELRARSAALQAAIAQHIAGDEAQIVELKAQLENVDTSLDDKENISRQIDHLTEEIDRKIKEQNVRLEQISGLSSEDAKNILIENMKAEANLLKIRWL